LGGACLSAGQREVCVTMKRGGSMAAPMPSGVPVRITVPGNSVASLLAQTISCAQLKIWSEVFESWAS
jgi:hypothetical protein